MKDEIEWHCAIDGESRGPFDLEEVRSLHAEGRIDRETYVWTQGLRDWVLLEDSGLKGLLDTGPAGPWAAPVPPAPPVTRQTADTQALGEEAAQPEDLYPWDYFKLCVTRKYATFSGRARRKEYWSFYLFAMVAYGIAFLLGAAIDPRMVMILLLIAVLGFLLPQLALTVRRFHDVGMSGWFVLLSLVPYVGGIFVLVVALIPSQKTDNRWGPVPVPV